MGKCLDSSLEKKIIWCADVCSLLVRFVVFFLFFFMSWSCDSCHITQPHPKTSLGTVVLVHRSVCVCVCVCCRWRGVKPHAFSQQNSETEGVDRISAPSSVGLATPQACSLIINRTSPSATPKAWSVSVAVRLWDLNVKLTTTKLVPGRGKDYIYI